MEELSESAEVSVEQLPSTVARPTWHPWLIAAIGLISGAAAGMNALTDTPDPSKTSANEIIAIIGLGALVGLLSVAAIAFLTRRLIVAAGLLPDTANRYLRRDLYTYLPLLVTLLGAIGVQFSGPVVVLLILLIAALKIVPLYGLMNANERQAIFSSLGWLAFLFLISGFAALIYQIVWERVLFAAFGVNIESITIVVSLFMFGLGLGSLAGGALARRMPNRLPLLFLACELAIGLFGLASIPLIKTVSRATLHGSLFSVSLTIFALLVLPTMLMGATLPILVSHLYRYYKNVGKSVGILYCINTVGSAIACFVTADVLFVLMGEQASVIVAAICNFTVGVLVMRYARRIARNDAAPDPSDSEETHEVMDEINGASGSALTPTRSRAGAQSARFSQSSGRGGIED